MKHIYYVPAVRICQIVPARGAAAKVPGGPGVYDKKVAVEGWHGQTRLTVGAAMGPVAQEDTLKLRLGVPPVGPEPRATILSCARARASVAFPLPSPIATATIAAGGASRMKLRRIDGRPVSPDGRKERDGRTGTKAEGKMKAEKAETGG
jgi:hypothetical protein